MVSPGTAAQYKRDSMAPFENTKTYGQHAVPGRGAVAVGWGREVGAVVPRGEGWGATAGVGERERKWTRERRSEICWASLPDTVAETGSVEGPAWKGRGVLVCWVKNGKGFES